MTLLPLGEASQGQWLFDSHHMEGQRHIFCCFHDSHIDPHEKGCCWIDRFRAKAQCTQIWCDEEKGVSLRWMLAVPPRHTQPWAGGKAEQTCRVSLSFLLQRHETLHNNSWSWHRLSWACTVGNSKTLTPAQNSQLGAERHSQPLHSSWLLWASISMHFYACEMGMTRHQALPHRLSPKLGRQYLVGVGTYKNIGRHCQVLL